MVQPCWSWNDGAMNVVITGGTRGIGLGLAREFLRRGHAVALSGRSREAVDRALADLAQSATPGGGRALGVVADVRDFASVQSLWDQAVAALGRVDLWINNAGITHRRLAFSALPAEQIEVVTATNVLGTLYGCRVAIAGMLGQSPPGGRVFNMEGFGSDGLKQPGMTIYGTTKNAVRYLTRALVTEYRDTPVLIGTISPGIVVTDLLTRDLYEPGSAEFARRRRFLNVLADPVETVAPYLVDGVLAASRTGADVRWMGPLQALGRVLKCLVVRRDPFAGQVPAP
jgi:NAD(P)-dependent dehydrogenase (short-subunit alcohol dehydrogenase family)